MGFPCTFGVFYVGLLPLRSVHRLSCRFGIGNGLTSRLLPEQTSRHSSERSVLVSVSVTVSVLVTNRDRDCYRFRGGIGAGAGVGAGIGRPHGPYCEHSLGIFKRVDTSAI